MRVLFTFKELSEPGNPFDYDDELEDDLRDGGRYAVSWKKFGPCNEIYPQHSHRAESLILDQLGYLPYPTVYKPHEVFIRTLIEEMDSGKITPEQALEQSQLHIRHIRNEDMEREDVVLYPMYTAKQESIYNSYLVEYADAAKQRLAQLLGYKPLLNNSLQAEILLRERAAEGKLTSGMTADQIKPHDCKAMTIVKYREIFATQGLRPAMESPLFAWQLRITT